ncbi:MYG1_protein [Hexamita inflata]|uniref:MYG1 protein n=1 Tax=Hexamita inflata TaxID=28002 RepID=A0AA86UTK2_9EUKA|nr:MYG1 protein [Hexamita inflata]
MNIVTHSNDFHADDCLSTFFLKQIFDVASVVRSRDEEIIKKADIAYDVGGIYNKASLRFDHHQLGFNEFFPNSTVPLSSAGVIYRDFGREILLKLQPDLTPLQLDFLYDFVYFQFVQALDGNDNGIDPYESPVINYNATQSSLASRVHRCNYISDFNAAVTICAQDFTDFVVYASTQVLPSFPVLQTAFESRFNVHISGRVLLLNNSVNNSLLEHFQKQFGCDILFIVNQKADRVSLKALSVPGSFKSKQQLPKNWCGLRDAELVKESGVEGGIFVHKNGFLGVWTTVEQVMQVLAKIL